MARIEAPNGQYTGVSAGVMFVNGVGHTDDPYLIRWFEEHGYAVKEAPESKSNKKKGKGDEQPE